MESIKKSMGRVFENAWNKTVIVSGVKMENIIFNRIKNMEFNCLFKQLDLLIINLGDPIKFSIHIACAVRICQGGKIVLNVSDEFFTEDGSVKDDEVYKQLEKDGMINDPNSLLAANIKKVNYLLKGKTINDIKVSKWFDLILYFDDEIEIQIMPDCLERDFEYYRLIEFFPFYDSEQYQSTHFVVRNDQGYPKMKLE